MLDKPRDKFISGDLCVNLPVRRMFSIPVLNIFSVIAADAV